MANAFSYACRDCEGMEACPASVVAETKDEVWRLIELHAQVAHEENPADWDGETREYLATLIRSVSVLKAYSHAVDWSSRWRACWLRSKRRRSQPQKAIQLGMYSQH